MNLKARLRALETASGRRPTDPGLPALSQPEDVHSAPAGLATAAEQALATSLGGRVVAPGLIHRALDLAPGYRHGDQVLAEVLQIGPEPLGVAVPSPARGWLFLDTETTGLAGGTGTLVFLFGGVQVDSAGFRLHQWLLTRFAGESCMLASVQHMLDQAALIVSFNGKSFDLPLLRTRLRLHGKLLREAHLVHLDLLHPARSAFAACWPDVRLQTAEQRLCAYWRDDDLPGAQAPQAFADWLRHARSDGLMRVMQHHRDDVLSLVALCAALAQAYRNPRPSGADEGGILRRLRRRGYRVRAGQACLAFSP